MAQVARLGVWFAAVFVAGGAAGGAGLSWWSAGSAPSPRAAQVPPDQSGGHQRGEDELEPGSVAAFDRDALRAALVDLLREEQERAEMHARDEEGVSAAEVLVRLEQAYRAELEAQADLAQADPERAAPEQTQALDLAEHEALAEQRALAAALPADGLDAQPQEPEAAQAASPPAASPPAASPPAASPPAIASNVQIESVRVHNGDVNQVDARQVTITNRHQPVFVYAPTAVPSNTSVATRRAAPSSRSPLSQPFDSAHDQSPFSSVDYSRHHNPWGPTFGRRVP